MAASESPQAQASAGQFALLDVPANDAAQLTDGLESILRGRGLGLVLRGAFPADALAAVVARLESGECSLNRQETPYFKGFSYGGIVVLAGDSLESYLEESRTFSQSCTELFAGAPDYLTRLEELLRVMSSGRAVAVPQARDGRSYIPSSIRGVAPGGKIDLHCENETVDFPGMRHLSTLIDPRGQLSFYLTLAEPEGGGDIVISSLRYGEGPGRELLDLDRDTPATLRMVDGFPSVTPRLHAGDMLIFNAGRHYHRVTEVKGSRKRWTMGGFLAFSRDHEKFYYWS